MCVCLSPRAVEPYTISTLAGNGTFGFSGDGGPASSASMSNPVGVASNPLTGNVYFADADNGCVRSVNTVTGNINTVAGMKMMFGYSGDSGPATYALLSYPSDVDVDISKNLLYIADTYNDAIRMVDIGTGIITTVAGMGMRGSSGDGGQATSAYLSGPNSVAFDSSSRTLYISDSGNCAIRSLSVASGIINTLITVGYCGSGSSYGSYFSTLTGGIAVYPSTGTVYYMDPTYNTLKAVTASTLKIVTVAGNGLYGYYGGGDGGVATEASFNKVTSIAVNSTNGDIYIVDGGSSNVRMITSSNNIINTVAGTGFSGYSGDGGMATKAQFSYPSGVAVDANTGMLYIADTYNYRIRVLSADLNSLGETRWTHDSHLHIHIQSEISLYGSFIFFLFYHAGLLLYLFVHRLL